MKIKRYIIIRGIIILNVICGLQLSSSGNPFKDAVKEEDKYRAYWRSEIIKFSDELLNTMDLKREELREGFTWSIPGYTICVKSHPWNGWENILEVFPEDISTYCGYSNIPGKPPESWHFLPMGTATEILPEKQTRKIILEIIRGELK